MRQYRPSASLLLLFFLLFLNLILSLILFLILILHNIMLKMSSLARIRVAAPRQQDWALQRASDITSLRKASTDANKGSLATTNEKKDQVVEKEEVRAKKTMAQLDEELREKLEGRSGDGGAAGLELEGGKPVAMKRGVRENMFRLI